MLIAVRDTFCFYSKMIAEGKDQRNEIDYIIELSILKVRRMQISGVREERHRLLVLGTLHQSIVQKLEEMELDGNVISMNRSVAFLSILQDAIRRLGLVRLVRFNVSLPDNDNDLPRLKLPLGRRARDNNTIGMNINDAALTRNVSEYCRELVGA